MKRWQTTKWFIRQHQGCKDETYALTYIRCENFIQVHVYKIDGKSRAEYFKTTTEDILRAVEYFCKAEEDIRKLGFKLDDQDFQIR